MRLPLKQQATALPPIVDLGNWQVGYFFVFSPFYRFSFDPNPTFGRPNFETRASLFFM
jgi:hypothetical protein